MHWRVKVVAGVTLLGIVLALLCWQQFSESSSMESKGNRWVESVEKFRSSQGSLPLISSEMGLQEEMGNGPFYERIDLETYRVYFTIGFDDLYEYHSGIEEWKDKP